MGKQHWNGNGKPGAATSAVRAAAAAAALGTPGTGWEPRQPPSPLPSPLRAEAAPGGGFSRGAPPFHQHGWGDPTQGLGSAPAAWLTSNAAAARRFPARCQRPPRARPETPAPLPAVSREHRAAAAAPAPGGRSPLHPRPGAGTQRPPPRTPTPFPASPPAAPRGRPPATPLPSGAGEGQARLVPASDFPQVNSGFLRPAGSAWAPGPPGGREGGERRVLPWLPPPPLLEADRRYKRPGRGPAVASVSADAQAVGRGRSGERGAAAGQAEAARGSPWATPMRGLSAAALCWSYSSAEGSLHTAGWAGLQRCRSL